MSLPSRLLKPKGDLKQAKEKFNALKRENERFERGEWDALSTSHLLLFYPLKILLLTIQQVKQDRVMMRASSLAFITVTSLVPMLVVAGSLIMVFGSGDSQGQSLIDVIQSYLLPVAGTKISAFIRTAIERTTQAGVGIVGGLALIFVSVTLVMEIENSFNDIWKVTQRRPLQTRVLLFYTLVTIGPMLLMFSMVQTTKIGITISKFGTLGGLAPQMVPFFNSVILFMIVNKLLPHTKVHWIPALVSALLAAFLFEITKFGFTYYVSNVLMARYDQIYGALSLIPIFLMWVYISWVLTLSSAELTYTIQHIRHLMRSERIERHFSQAGEYGFVGSNLITLEILLPITTAFWNGNPPLDIDQIAAQSGHPHILVYQVLKRFEHRGMIVRMEKDGVDVYVPAKPLRHVSLLEILDLMDGLAGKYNEMDALRDLVERLLNALESALHGLTLDTLTESIAADVLKDEKAQVIERAEVHMTENHLNFCNSKVKSCGYSMPICLGWPQTQKLLDFKMALQGLYEPELPLERCSTGSEKTLDD